MATTLTRDDVLRIAELARLELSEAEVEVFTRQIADILQYAAQIREADTTGVSPTSHALANEAAWREDAPGGSLDLADSLANAPSAQRDAGLFKVPKVL
jgi:aspartyl-tRNA(Asn)/glutamyl-tRNA(Gln) amidotransferase subunit C